MLGENIKALRKRKGLTQEELAIRLRVVRQTVSKWEKGLSVPDAEMLQRLAEVLDTDVAQLLGAEVKNEQSENEENEIVEQLSRLNEQLAIKNRRARRIWRIVGIVLAAILLFNLLLVILGGVIFTVRSHNVVDEDETYSVISSMEEDDALAEP